jgi:hypothetical protein
MYVSPGCQAYVMYVSPGCNAYVMYCPVLVCEIIAVKPITRCSILETHRGKIISASSRVLKSRNVQDDNQLSR